MEEDDLTSCHPARASAVPTLVRQSMGGSRKPNVDKLAEEDGVQYLVRWITNRYLDLEVTRIGKAFSKFFRKLRRKPGQSIRDYNSEYDRLHARLREVGCNLPEDCAAWLYVDRLQLEEAAELNLLASVGNAYSLGRLQQAAVIHDRGHRKPWENGNGKGRRPHTAHFTEADDYLASGDEDIENENDSDEGVPEEVAVAYATYQTAKQRYKEHQKSRGFVQASDYRPEQPLVNKTGEKTSEKIRLMKAKSFCSGCGRRGHWHKDAECPHNQGGQQRGHDKGVTKPAEVGFCNLLPAEVFAIKHEEANLLGITDTACARTVAGTQWLQAHTDKQAKLGFRPELRKECEAYRFGTGKIYYSSFYVVLAFELGNKIVQVRTSIINGDVPLLLSKTVLGKLGMVFDIEKGQADFSKVGLKGFDLLVTASGHPAIPIVPTKMDGDSAAFQAEDLKLVPKCQYMAFAVAHGCGSSRGPDMYNFFYDKKLDPGVKDMLVREKLPQEEFVAWWSSATVSSDFWLECEHAWVRIHITPRKNLFNPSTWKTRATVQKEMLVQTAAEIRVTDGVCCTSGRWIEPVIDRWERDKLNEPAFDFHWIGRTWIGKRQAPSFPLRTAFENGTGPMETPSHQPHEQDPVVGGGKPHGRVGPPHVERSGDQGLHNGSPRGGEEPRSHGADEEGVPHEPGRTPNQGGRVEDRLRHQDDQGQPYPPDKGLAQHPGGGAHEDREVQGTPVPRNSPQLWRVGSARADACGQPGPGAGEIREVVQQPAEEPGDERLSRDQRAHSVPKLDCGNSEIVQPDFDLDGEGFLGHGGRQRDRPIYDKHEAEDETRDHRGEGDGHRIGPEGGGRDRRVRDEARGLEGQGQGDHHQVSGRRDHDREEDTDRGGRDNFVLNPACRDRGGHRGGEFGGRKCCPDLPRDHFFSEGEFLHAHQNRHEVCWIDFEHGDGPRHDIEDDSEDYHAIPEEGDDIEVYECKEFSFEERVIFAYDSGDFSFSTCQELLEDPDCTVLHGKHHRGKVIDGAKNSAVFGFYVYGGMNGITKAVTNNTALTRYLNHFVAAHTPRGAVWSAISVFKGGAVKVHHDYNNAPGSKNYFASFGQSSGGELWLHDREINEEDVARDPEGKIQWRKTGSGDWLPGRLLTSQERFIEFDPHTKHRVTETDGEAWQVIAYSPRGTDKLDNTTEKFLRNCGFPLDHKKRRHEGQATRKPSKRQRNAITNMVGKLSVLFTTLLVTANSFLHETAHNDVIYDPVVMLEIGGFDATLEATELNKAVMEPLSWEDYLDHGTKDRTLHLVRAITPRQLHLHLGQAPEDALGDLRLLVREQLEGGGAVILQGGKPQWVVEDVDHYLRYNKNHEGEDWTVLARPGTRHLQLPESLCPHHVLVVNDRGGGPDERPLRMDGSGITFQDGVPGHVRSALKRLHQNLGHPRNADLVRHLRLSGCETAVLKAAKGMKCQVCDSTREPQVARPSSLPRMLSFGEVVCADILYAHDCDDKKHVFLSMVDVGTTYQVVVKLKSTSGKEVEQAFNTCWLTPFGAPRSISLDLETGLQDGFSRLCSWHNVKIRNSATQAHFQSGVGERQGKWWKNIWARVCKELSITAEEVQLAATAVSSAKNCLRRRCGHSPYAWIFGREGRAIEDVLDPDISRGTRQL